jgi:hypothetical protein
MNGELEELGERIAEHAAHLDAATHRLLADLRDFDRRGGWHAQGALSCAHWLAWRVGWDLVTARERVRVAGKLADFALIDDALRRGELSYSKVRALLRIASPANEAMLLEHARLMTASQLEKLSRKYALVQRHGQEDRPQDDVQRRYVRRRDMDDGMVKIEAVLHPEEAEMVWAMLDHAAKQLGRASHPDRPAGAACVADSAEARAVSDAAVPVQVGAAQTSDGPSRVADTHAITEEDDSAEACTAPGRSLLDRLLGEADAAGSAPTATAGPCETSGATPSPACAPGVLHQQVDATRRAFNRADALLSVAQAYLRGDRTQRAPVEVTITIPASSLRRDGDDAVDVGWMGSSCMSSEATRRLSCDAGVIEVTEDEHGVPLSVGRKRRTIAGSIKRALLKRDTACSFPGCTHQIFLEGHHLVHWADGGETALENAALLCSHHHRYVHEYGYGVELGLDKRPRFRDPGGRLVAAVPPARDLGPALGWPQLRAANELLAIDAETIACEWDGRPVDYGRVIDELVVVDDLT